MIQDNLKDKIFSYQVNQSTQSAYDCSDNIDIVNFITSLKDYYKIVSLKIQHHQQSINSLQSSLLCCYPQLFNRVQTIINKSKLNVQFLNLITEPYDQFVYNYVLINKAKSNLANKSINHKCHNHNQNHTSIINMFYSLVMQWSQYCNLNYISEIVFHIQGYLKRLSLKQNNNSGLQKTKILIVQCGMGRILKQLRKQLDQYEIFVQGHQSQIQSYLCAQYFLNRCLKTSEIYPYIHNFSNFLHQEDPYRKVIVPHEINEKTTKYSLTLGNFMNKYKYHTSNWSIIVTLFNNYNVYDVLQYLKLIHKMLCKGGIWIDFCTASFDRNVIPITYRQYEFILDNSEFNLLAAGKINDYWFLDKKSLLNQKRIVYYRIMQK